MKFLVAEDDFASRKFLTKLLSRYGTCDVAVNGKEAIDAFLLAIKDGQPYKLICLDIMMPEVDGIRTLKTIREIEAQFNIQEEYKAVIIMISALNGVETVENTFDSGAQAYASKPLDINKFIEVLKRLKIIN